MLNRRDMNDHARSMREHRWQQRTIELHRGHQVEVDLLSLLLVIECSEPTGGRLRAAEHVEVSCHDLESRDSVALEREAVPELDRTAGKVAGDPRRDNGVGSRNIGGNRHACIVILRSCLGLPTRDSQLATVLTLFVDDDRAFGEAPSHTIGVSRIGCEVGGNRRR